LGPVTDGAFIHLMSISGRIGNAHANRQMPLTLVVMGMATTTTTTTTTTQ